MFVVAEAPMVIEHQNLNAAAQEPHSWVLLFELLHAFWQDPVDEALPASVLGLSPPAPTPEAEATLHRGGQRG